MTLTDINEYILSHYEASADHSFEDRSVTVFSRCDNKKWFAATKNIKAQNVGVDGAGRIDILNLKLNPRDVAALRVREGFRPAWRMNQNSWVSVLLDGSVPDEEICRLLDRSFSHVGARGKKA